MLNEVASFLERKGKDDLLVLKYPQYAQCSWYHVTPSRDAGAACFSL